MAFWALCTGLRFARVCCVVVCRLAIVLDKYYLYCIPFLSFVEPSNTVSNDNMTYIIQQCQWQIRTHLTINSSSKIYIQLTNRIIVFLFLSISSVNPQPGRQNRNLPSLNILKRLIFCLVISPCCSRICICHMLEFLSCRYIRNFNICYYCISISLFGYGYGAAIYI